MKIVNGLLFSQKNYHNVQLHSIYASVAFLWIGFNCINATEPLRSGSLHFTTQSTGNPGTHLIDIRR